LTPKRSRLISGNIYRRSKSRSDRKKTDGNIPCPLLRGREEHIQDLVSIARKELAQLAGKTSDSGVYTQFMKGTTVQKFFQIMESKVFILVFRELVLPRNLHLRAIKS